MYFDVERDRVVVDVNGTPWTVKVEWTSRRGQSHPRSITFALADSKAIPPALGRLRASNLRHFPFKDALNLARQGRAERRASVRVYKDLDAASRTGAKRSVTDPSSSSIPTGPQQGARIGREQSQLVARIYKQAVENGTAVTDAVADALNVSRSTATKRIMRARRDGFLAPTGEDT